MECGLDRHSWYIPVGQTFLSADSGDFPVVRGKTEQECSVNGQAKSPPYVFALDSGYFCIQRYFASGSQPSSPFNTFWTV